MSQDFQAIWLKCTEKIRQSINENAFNSWIKPLVPVSFSGSVFTVEVKTDFFKSYFEQNYASTLEGVLSEVTGTRVILHVQTSSAADAPSEETAAEYKEKTQQTVLFGDNNNAFKDTEVTNLNPKYDFENFVIGNSNRYPHAAALAVANNPGFAYNPLFLYGATGLGKTHLMQAIGNRIKQNNPSMRVLYTTSEIFTNEIVTSIRTNSTEAFRKKYRNIDCLIIDDIQFLKGKDATQEEFFHTFNTLKNANKQIIISSDRSPRELEILEDRLRSRFDQGLTADIQPPDLETRMAIIRKMASSDNIEMPNEVVTLLATNISTNIREIEGAYNRMVAYTSLMNMPIDTETAKKVLGDIGKTVHVKQITFSNITGIVAARYNVKEEDLFTKKRPQNIAFPRQIAMYLCRTLADLSYPRIGELFGGRDHTTVIHAYEKISSEIKRNKSLKDDINSIIEELKQ